MNNTSTKRALVTGAAGFIGSHLVDDLLLRRWEVTAIDNFDPFYPKAIKQANIVEHLANPNYQMLRADIRDLKTLRSNLTGEYDVIIHLAAKPGVRPSINNPIDFQETNVCGTQNLLELARLWKTPQFIFASSSSVYGVNPNVPWQEDDRALLPISPYASTKVSAELLGHVYSHLFGIRFIALRFFTVYGPRQRPDLAIYKFARLMRSGHTIPVFGAGDTRRDYTYVSDITAGIRAAMDYNATPYEIFNLGNNTTVSLLELIRALGEVLGVKPNLDFQPPQPGDVPQTWACTEKARLLLDYQPKVTVTQGLINFADWLARSQHQPILNTSLDLSAKSATAAYSDSAHNSYPRIGSIPRERS